MLQSLRLNRALESRQKGSAFTLVELLVAIAIVAFVIVVLAQIISSAQAIWKNSEARTDAFRDARAAIELISRDLALSLTNDRAPVLALTNLFTQTSDPTAGPQNNQQVYALIPLRNVGDPPVAGPPPANTPARTDVCAVGFYCSWDAQRHAYVLRKHVLQSNPTFTRLQAAFGAPTPTPPPLPSPAPTGAPVAPANVYSPTNPAVTPAEDEDVAAYVWDLKIVAYDNIAGVPTPSAYPIVYRATLPQFLEVSFKAFSPSSARQLEAQNIDPDVWFDTTTPIYKNQIAPHVQVFSTRIRLQNARTP